MTATAGGEIEIGGVFATSRGAEPVSEVGIRRYVEAHELDCPAYVDEAAARAAGWPGVIAPWSMLLTMAMPPYWSPGQPPLDGPVLPPFAWCDLSRPGTEMVTTAVDLRFVRPLLVGDVVETTYRVTRCVDKRTRLGDGTFFQFEVDFHNQRGEQVARETTSIYRYVPADAAPATPPGAATAGSAPEAGGTGGTGGTGDGDLGATRMDLSLQRLIMVSAANRDFALSHIDPSTAREGGVPTAFADIMFILACCEKLLVQWGGPATRLRRIGPLRFGEPVLCGKPVVTEGRITSTDRMPDDHGAPGVEVGADLAIHQEEGRTCVGAGATVWLPRLPQHR